MMSKLILLAVAIISTVLMWTYPAQECYPYGLIAVTAAACLNLKSDNESD